MTDKTTNPLNPLLQPLQQRFNALAPREKTLVGFTSALVLLAIVWWTLLGPAIRTLRSAEAQHLELDAQLQQMQALASQAETLKAQPRMNYDDAVRALESAVRARLGTTALLSIVGERATITIKGIGPEALAQWLAQVRSNARLLPAEARLARSSEPGSSSWDGTVVFTLPPRQ